MNNSKMQELHTYKKLLNAGAIASGWRLNELKTTFNIRLYEATVSKNVSNEISKLNEMLGADRIISFGDHMPMKEFIESCQRGWFSDYDGTGYYATANRQAPKEIIPSDTVDGNYDTRFTHVVWYNR